LHQASRSASTKLRSLEWNKGDVAPRTRARMACARAGEPVKLQTIPLPACLIAAVGAVAAHRPAYHVRVLTAVRSGGLERPCMPGVACGQQLRRALVIPSLHSSRRTPGRLFGRRERPSSRTLAHSPIYKCLIQPMPTVVTPPNLSAHKPAGDRASRYKDRPQMPSRCPCLEPIQSQYPAVDRCEADGSHRDPLGSIAATQQFS
jgi:hypothetical protein